MKLEIDCKRVNYGGRGNKEKEIGRSGEDN
jgi:hypothetical protein